MQRDSRGWFVAGDWEPRFYSRIEEVDGCWLWRGSTMYRGYGRFHVNGRSWRAHRFAYEALVGPIGEATLDHLCRNRLCVNPAHLEPVSVRENVLRGQGLSAKHAQATHCPAGHPYDEANTYRWGRLAQSRQCRACGRLRAATRRQAAR